jgi:hypothetical protein
VYSTPRPTASKIRAKKSVKPAESEEQRNLRHGKAFRDLEPSMLELYCMAEIAAEAATGMHEDKEEITHFAGRGTGSQGNALQQRQHSHSYVSAIKANLAGFTRSSNETSVFAGLFG